MIKALFFKEWLKLKWPFWSMIGLVILLLVKLALNISYNIRLMEAKNYWYYITVQGWIFYSDFNFIFVFIALVIVTAQFMPEITNDRLKLTLHLPFHEDATLMYMVLYGTVVFSAIYFFTAGLLVGIVSHYFPVQIVRSVCLTMFPWGLAGLVIYWSVAAIFVERIWMKRIFLIIVTTLYVSTLLYNYAYQIYEHTIGYFVLLSALFSISIIYTGHRYRKGVLK